MTLPSSGELSYSEINVELGNNSTTVAKMYDMAVTAQKSTTDIGVDDWYGYTHSGGNITLSKSSDDVQEGDLVTNTLTSSGNWTATIYDPDNIINSISPSSGTGNGTVGCEIVNPGPSSEKSADITYELDDSALYATWTINYYPPGPP